MRACFLAACLECFCRPTAASCRPRFFLCLSAKDFWKGARAPNTVPYAQVFRPGQFRRSAIRDSFAVDDVVNDGKCVPKLILSPVRFISRRKMSNVLAKSSSRGAGEWEKICGDVAPKKELFAGCCLFGLLKRHLLEHYLFSNLNESATAYVKYTVASCSLTHTVSHQKTIEHERRSVVDFWR